MGSLLFRSEIQVLSSPRGGAHGGYRLARDPGKISLYDIVNVLEGSTCVVECVKQPGVCDRVEFCPTRSVVGTVWTGTISDFLKGVTLESLVADGNAAGKKEMYFI